MLLRLTKNFLLPIPWQEPQFSDPCMASPPSSPPQPKKLKMSTTSNSSAEDEDSAAIPPTAAEPNRRRYKRRKIAIFFSYCGAGYQGMQKNPGARTIEGEFEEALFHAGAVPESDRGNPKRYDWARAARTDKGVSAAGQVVSGRFYIDPPGFIDRLNSLLADQIRVWGFKRVTASFNAKKFCDRRRYVYLLPVFALDPNAHPDRESVVASLGSENELARCLECSERGRKVFGAIGRQFRSLKEEDRYELDGDGDGDEDELPAEVKLVSKTEVFVTENGFGELKELDVPSNPESAKTDREVDDEGKAVETEELHLSNCKASAGEEKVESVVSVDAIEEKLMVATSSYSYGDLERKRFNLILNRYVGTHNFHNFTTRTKAEDPSARRYIISFNADSTITIGGIEFIKCEVVGQSFMLHQIRKMIGLAVALMRNCAPESLMDIALRHNFCLCQGC
ncbi:tRNA pseudouridine synthase A, mitochondrial-like isoform X2 [Phalaenopsis equestris]|uniref:tRNA pseudouridine synthase A, mitochondrial-like isoform X2 n=1 Tax=Phalaenopsis equestris TaxID=78828 RepID=UPI0009E42E00|nr:tRNA pseudouridine synthase A, mitochondrial-like isoform X2 [Phalaenopsis equestris]